VHARVGDTTEAPGGCGAPSRGAAGLPSRESGSDGNAKAVPDRGHHVGDVGRGEGRKRHEARRSLGRLGILGVDAVEEQDMQMWGEPEV
jgi:hypothetical protein